jgi:putative ABC transport system substrate-binding protein
MPTIGILGSSSPTSIARFLAAFRQGLGETGFVEGQNLRIEYRWAENKYERLPALAAELVGRSVAVIVAAGGPDPVLAAKAATATIPIVFSASSDPVKLGLVASLHRPGGNVTGSAMLTAELEPKRIELLRELAPKARVIGALVNPDRTDVDAQTHAVQDAARKLGFESVVLRANHERDIAQAFDEFVRRQVGALAVGADPVFHNRRAQIVALAARNAIPAIYSNRDFVVAGGLMSYGTDIADGFRQAGVYTGRILKGAMPADLPVVQPTKFELVINLKTAKALGIEVPMPVLMQVSDVIE